jgi:hypothetical protein
MEKPSRSNPIDTPQTAIPPGGQSPSPPPSRQAKGKHWNSETAELLAIIAEIVARLIGVVPQGRAALDQKELEENQ